MVDMSHKTIKHLFEQQVADLTRRTVGQPVQSTQSLERQAADIFDFQMSGAWV